METRDVKIGQKVTVARAELFYAYNLDNTGTVTVIDGDYITVNFNDGGHDYGYASALDLVQDVVPVVPVVAANVKEAIAKVESALAELKALVG